jgi:hypothetical protein
MTQPAEPQQTVIRGSTAFAGWIGALFGVGMAGLVAAAWSALPDSSRSIAIWIAVGLWFGLMLAGCFALRREGVCEIRDDGVWFRRPLARGALMRWDDVQAVRIAAHHIRLRDADGVTIEINGRQFRGRWAEARAAVFDRLGGAFDTSLPALPPWWRNVMLAVLAVWFVAVLVGLQLADRLRWEEWAGPWATAAELAFLLALFGFISLIEVVPLLHPAGRANWRATRRWRRRGEGGAFPVNPTPPADRLTGGPRPDKTWP